MSGGSIKGKIIGAIVGTVLIAGIAGGVLFFQDKLFRSIVAEEVSGTVTATGDSKKGQLTKGEHLYGGDFVEVGDESGLTLCADNTKYLYADPNTSFRIEADSMNPTKNIKIVMESGSTLHELTEKLEAGDTYEVVTPYSTMAVRGTSFRVTVLEANNGMTYTLTEVKTGEVKVNLKDHEGMDIGEAASFKAGQSALMKGNEVKSEFVINKETGSNVWILDYQELPTDSIERLEELISDATEEHEHVAGDWIVTSEPTCHSEGTRVRYCTICDMEMRTQSIAMTEHTYGDWSRAENPGCENEGRDVRTCSVCGYEDSRSVAALGHQWTLTGTVEPHCQADVDHPLVDGENDYTCDRCSATKTEVISCTGHSGLVQAVGLSAECLYSGSMAYDCTACNFYAVTGRYAYSETLPPTGHTWEFAYEEDGQSYWRCGVCGANGVPGINATDPPDAFWRD